MSYLEHLKEHAMQNPEELEFLINIAKNLGAKKILEIGTCGGYTAAALASIGAEVTTMDIFEVTYFPWDEPEYKAEFPNSSVKYVHHDSRTFMGAQAVRLPNDEKYDLVFIDGEHSDLTGYMDWKQYAEMSKGPVAIHDINNYQTMFDKDWFPRTFWRMVKAGEYQSEESVGHKEPLGHDSAGMGVVFLKEGDYSKLTKAFEKYLLNKFNE
jgi:hypothetical protein